MRRTGTIFILSAKVALKISSTSPLFSTLYPLVPLFV